MPVLVVHSKKSLVLFTDLKVLSIALDVNNSFGHSCIYLLGGPTREQSPTPILLQSGDILVMTGPCRSAFHGKPPLSLTHTHTFSHFPLSN